MSPALLSLLVLSEPLVLWHSYTRSEREALEAALATYPAKVEASFVPFSALADKLTAAIPRGHGPDVFIFAHDRVGGWAEGHLVEPLELLVDEPMLDEQLTTCVFALAYADSLYGLPLAFKTLALFVRTDAIPEPPKDFDALLALAKAHTAKGTGRYGLVYPNSDLFFHTPLLFSLGGKIYADDLPSQARSARRGLPTRPKLSGLAAGFAMAKRLADEGVIPDDPSPPMASSMFSDGRAPMVISGPWFMSEIDPGVPYTVAPLPAFPGGKVSAGFTTCEGILMSRYSKRKREAFDLMRFLSGDPKSAEIRMRSGGQTVTLSKAWEQTLPTLPESERKKLEAFRRAFSSSVATPSHPSMNAAWTPLNAALYKVLHRGMEPGAAEAEAQERIDKALDLGS
ncbi:MAG: extracellular solute-binding protein [Deltaproteobacteria bacterium]|nr:extracellular solute-binding protein [Deltaproteobacteria bacterium]